MSEDTHFFVQNNLNWKILLCKVPHVLKSLEAIAVPIALRRLGKIWSAAAPVGQSIGDGASESVSLYDESQNGEEVSSGERREAASHHIRMSEASGCKIYRLFSARHINTTKVAPSGLEKCPMTKSEIPSNYG